MSFYDLTRRTLYTQIAKAADLPVTLAQVKAHLRIDLEDVDHDDVILFLMSAATAHVENYIGRAILVQTWTGGFSEVDCNGAVSLSRGPIQSVSAVDLLMNGIYQAQDPALWTWRPYSPDMVIVRPVSGRNGQFRIRMRPPIG